MVVMLLVTGLFALSVSVKVAVVTVAGSTGSLKMAVRAEDVDTLVAPSAGVVALRCNLLLERAAMPPSPAVPV